MSGFSDRRGVLFGAAGLVSLCAGCGRSVADKAADRELLLVEGAHPTKKEPTSAGKFYALMGIAETLVGVGTALRPAPALAARWSVSDDRLEWRFDLRPNARFHDGSAVTATWVAKMLNRACARPGVLRSVPIREIIAEGDKLVIRLKAPSVLLLPALANDSAIIFAPSSFDPAGDAVAAIGSGPYKIVDMTQQEVVVERWAGWDGPRPSIARARYLSASRPETRTALAESGQAGAVFDLDWPSERRLRGNANVMVIDLPSPRTTVLKVNAGHPFLADPRARRALSLAVDRTGIAKGLFGNAERAATQLLPAFMSDWRVPSLPPLRTDPAEARRLLAELGWRAGADGILVRNGQRFSLKLLSLSTRTDQPLITAALQQQFRQVGIEITILLRSVAEIVAAHQDGSLELAMFARNHMLMPDPLGVLLGDYQKGGSDWGPMGWDDPAMIEALETLASGVEPDRAAALREQVVRTLQDQLPLIPLIFNRRTAAFSKQLDHVTLDPLERSYRMADMRWTG